MAYQLLASGQDPFRAVGIGEAALYALLGFAVVFVGILFLIFVVWTTGKIISAVEGKAKTSKNKAKQKINTEENSAVENTATAVQTNEIDEETAAIITAAIMAYYQKNNPKCEFTVRRIKKI